MHRALMLSRAGQCGLEIVKTANCDVNAVASVDRPAEYSQLDLGESIMHFAATLQLHELPYDYASSISMDPPTIYPVCKIALCDTLHPEPLHTRVFTWQSHMGRCGGDDRCTQAHEVVRLASHKAPDTTLATVEMIKRLVVNHYDHSLYSYITLSIEEIANRRLAHPHGHKWIILQL